MIRGVDIVGFDTALVATYDTSATLDNLMQIALALDGDANAAPSFRIVATCTERQAELQMLVRRWSYGGRKGRRARRRLRDFPVTVVVEYAGEVFKERKCARDTEQKAAKGNKAAEEKLKDRRYLCCCRQRGCNIGPMTVEE